MIKKALLKKSTVLSVLVLSGSLLAANQPSSPFEKYDPNKVLRENKGNVQGIMSNGMLSPDQEMQIRDMIFQEFKMRDTNIQEKKDSGKIPLSDDEVLFLGPAETLKGTINGKYMIFNSTTKMFKYVEMEKYKKVVSSEEVQSLQETEQLKEQASGKVTNN